MVGQWTRAIQQAMKQETSNHDQPCEFFHWMRRVMLRTSIDVMIGKAFLQLEETEQSAAPDDVDFVDTFMKFQDTLEDVTAKAVVLPRPIALHFFLIPLEKRRKKLQRIIEKRLEQILQPKPADGNYSKSISSVGFWLQEVLVDDKQYSLLDMAEFIVGLLFAAHKNPAIGAAQSYLSLRENNNGSSENLMETCTAEARRFLEHPSWDQVIPSNHEEYSMLQRVCYETLRITAHSIGAVRTAKQEVMVEIKTMKNDKNSTTASTSSSYYYKIPKGASVSFSHIVPNLKESVWGENASKFNIQRQLTKRDTDQYRDEYKFTTFSHGVHKCPGQHLAMILLQASLSILLVEYTVEFASPKIPPLSFERATLAQRKGPVLVTIQNKNRR
jgi:cytochrome P450